MHICILPEQTCLTKDGRLLCPLRCRRGCRLLLQAAEAVSRLPQVPISRKTPGSAAKGPFQRLPQRFRLPESFPFQFFLLFNTGFRLFFRSGRHQESLRVPITSIVCTSFLAIPRRYCCNHYTSSISPF